MKVEELAGKVELILADVDGVLTDGGIILSNEGIETKKFHVRDGLGIHLWRRAGYQFGIVTARNSHIVKVRAAELNVDIIRQGVSDKLTTTNEVINELELEAAQVCFIGDDLTDLSVMRSVGFPVAVADAASEVCDAAKFETKRAGGMGAVRETIETILKAKKRWAELIRNYTGE